MNVKKLLFFLVLVFVAPTVLAQNNAIPFQAEDADSLGSDYMIATQGDITYITPKTDLAASGNPGIAEKVAYYEVEFPAPGTYDLYVKLRVGSGAYSDDSFFLADSFGEKPATASGWLTLNGLDFGATGGNEYVLTSTENTAGFEIFKWINASKTTGVSYEVSEGELTQTISIGSREDGLDIDKMAFGNTELFYRVSYLENGEPGDATLPADGVATLTIELADSLRPVTHVATGALYGVTASIPSNVDKYVAPLNPRMYVQPARSGSGFQQPYGAALPVAERLKNTTAEVTIRLADINPGWPYNYPGWDSWAAAVESVIDDKLNSGLDNYYGYEIWNEPYGTWQTEENGGEFKATLWKPTFDLIKQSDPDAKIIGPSFSYYNRGRLQDFLSYCKENNCLPDIICWHELGGAANITTNISSYRALEKELGIEPLEITINEYSSATHIYEGAPGVSALFIARFERNMVESAAISWWFTQYPGRLGSLLTPSVEPGGGWWFYKWYGEMTGRMVSVIPPSETGDGLDGFASLDLEEEVIHLGFGGGFRGTVTLEFNDIPATFGDSVDVLLQYVEWEDKDTPVAGPEMISLGSYGVEEGGLSLDVDVTEPLYGYRAVMTPKGKMISTGTEVETTPNQFALSQNYPNPFNPTTQIQYILPKNALVKLEVYNISGQKVMELVNEFKNAGTHQVQFDASGLASGVYIYRMVTPEFTQVKKMLLIK